MVVRLEDGAGCILDEHFFLLPAYAMTHRLESLYR